MKGILSAESQLLIQPSATRWGYRICDNALRAVSPVIIAIGLAGLLAGCGDGAGTAGKGSMDWPLSRGDATLSGYTSVSLPKEPVLRWAYKSGKRTVSSPVVLAGTTYWSDRSGKISGVDLTGKLAFEYDLKTAVEATPMIYDSTLYIGRIDGYMTALSLTRRDTLWNYETWGQISASPNIMKYGNRKAIVFGSYDNYLYCVDLKTGEELNRFESGYYLNGAAALWKGHVIYGGCDAWVRIIDCKTGITTDSLQLEAYVPASPAIMGDYCYVGDYSGNIYKLMLEGGKIARYKKIVTGDSESGSYTSVPAISEEAFYYLSSDKYIKAISRINGKEIWRYLLKGTVGESSPLICNDRVIVCTKTGIVSILDAKTGKLFWEYDTGEQITGSPAAIHKHFFILTAKGTLLCFGE